MTRPETLLLGRDPEALRTLFAVHHPESGVVVDVTHNAGVMWKGMEVRPIRCDIDPTHPLDVCADCFALPLRSGSIDVLVFDPPHLPVAASTPGSSGIERRQYGLTAHGRGREGDNVSGMFGPFLAEAKRVLRPTGVVFTKLTDIVHNHRYQWQLVDFVNAVRAAGMTACDMLVKGDPSGGNLKSSKWQRVYHLRRSHSYWIVVRPGSSCERASAPVASARDTVSLAPAVFGQVALL